MPRTAPASPARPYRKARRWRWVAAPTLLLPLTAGGLTGCASDGQTGALIGAGIGALAGQAIGGDTEGTLIGTAVGAGAGYVIGNEQDKDKAKAQEEREAYEPPRRNTPKGSFGRY